MGFREDMGNVVDSIRRDVIDGALELRLHAVVVRTRVWDGGRPGLGTATDTDVTLDPVPKVRPPSPREKAAAPGFYEDGDRVVDKLSPDYTEAQLTGRPIAAGSEVFWLIDGDEYRVVGQPLEGFLGWKVHLRRMHKRG